MKKNIPSILLLLYTSTLYMTYFTSDVVSYQLVVYTLILICYFFARKVPINNAKPIYVISCILAILYFIRAFIDIELLNVKQELYGSDFTVFFFMLNGIVFPIIMIPKIKHAKSYTWAFVLLGFVLVYSLYITYTNFINGVVFMSQDHRIMANEHLSVIQFGHLGLTAVILGIYFIAKSNKNKLFLILSASIVFLGVMSMFLAGTRSAMIAAFAIAAIYLLANAKIKALAVVILLFVPFYLYSDSILSFFDSFGINSANRIFQLFEEGGDQSSGRSLIWDKAFGDLSDNLLLGVSCFFKFRDWTYVHNSVIEITYALGIFGGIAFIYINCKALAICIKELKGESIDNKCFVFLYIQYFVYSLFSESVLRLSLYWIFLAIIISLSTQQNKEYLE